MFPVASVKPVSSYKRFEGKDENLHSTSCNRSRFARSDRLPDPFLNYYGDSLVVLFQEEEMCIARGSDG